MKGPSAHKLTWICELSAPYGRALDTGITDAHVAFRKRVPGASG